MTPESEQSLSWTPTRATGPACMVLEHTPTRGGVSRKGPRSYRPPGVPAIPRRRHTARAASSPRDDPSINLTAVARRGVVNSRNDQNSLASPSALARLAEGWIGYMRVSVTGVRRDKAALSSGCESHPANAPAGSNRSGYGGNEMAEAFG
jgi:hypothetical protein